MGKITKAIIASKNVCVTLLVMNYLHSSPLTHWGRDKMAAILQTTLSNAFSWMKMLEFWYKFYWSLLLRVQFTIIQHWFRWWLGADQATSHYLNQWLLVYRRIYASLGLNEFKSFIKKSRLLRNTPVKFDVMTSRESYWSECSWNCSNELHVRQSTPDLAVHGEKGSSHYTLGSMTSWLNTGCTF